MIPHPKPNMSNLTDPESSEDHLRADRTSWVRRHSAGKTAIQEPEEELVHTDDAVIGRAFRWSAVILAVLVIGGAVFLWVKSRKAATGPAKLTRLSAPSAASAKAAEIPTVKFSDITKESGITFIHNNGALGDKLLPETMGSGV